MAIEDIVRRRGDNRPLRLDSPIITQQMIEELRQGKAQQRRYNELRKLLLRRLEDGAIVEDGPLDLGITRSEQQRVTIAALVEWLGEDEVQEFRNFVEPTVMRTLVVFERRTAILFGTNAAFERLDAI